MSNENKTLLDLNPIFKGDTKNIDFSFTFEPENLDSDIVFDAPVAVSGRVFEKASGYTRSESLVMAQINLSGKYKTYCARCLEELDRTVDFSAEYSVATSLQNEEGEGMILAPSGILDIGECADGLFFMELPSKHLCSDDCKGLCQGCGNNLNREKCTCSGKNIDPRLAVLKKLLDK